MPLDNDHDLLSAMVSFLCKINRFRRFSHDRKVLNIKYCILCVENVKFLQ